MNHADAAGGARPRHVDLPAPPDVDVDVDQPFDLEGLYALRSTVAAHASHVGATSSELEAMVIIASELATNAIRYGDGTGRIRLWHDDHYLYVRIDDQGAGLADTSTGTILPEPQRIGGRGLWIVRSLSHDLIIGPGPDGRGTHVTALVRRGDATSA